MAMVVNARVQALVEDMVSSCEFELQKWEEACRAGGPVEISVEEDLTAISNSIIAHTAFSADREKAKEIYRTQRKYVSLLFESLDSGLYWIPGFRFGQRIQPLMNLDLIDPQEFFDGCSLGERIGGWALRPRGLFQGLMPVARDVTSDNAHARGLY
jgi:hypothetical protein